MLFVLGKNQLKMYSCRTFTIHEHIFQSSDGGTSRNLDQRPGRLLFSSSDSHLSGLQRAEVEVEVEGGGRMLTG